MSVWMSVRIFKNIYNLIILKKIKSHIFTAHYSIAIQKISFIMDRQKWLEHCFKRKKKKLFQNWIARMNSFAFYPIKNIVLNSKLIEMHRQVKARLTDERHGNSCSKWHGTAFWFIFKSVHVQEAEMQTNDDILK